MLKVWKLRAETLTSVLPTDQPAIYHSKLKIGNGRDSFLDLPEIGRGDFLESGAIQGRLGSVFGDSTLQTGDFKGASWDHHELLLTDADNGLALPLGGMFSGYADDADLPNAWVPTISGLYRMLFTLILSPVIPGHSNEGEDHPYPKIKVINYSIEGNLWSSAETTYVGRDRVVVVPVIPLMAGGGVSFVVSVDHADSDWETTMTDVAVSVSPLAYMPVVW